MTKTEWLWLDKRYFASCNGHSIEVYPPARGCEYLIVVDGKTAGRHTRLALAQAAAERLANKLPF